MEKKEVLLVPNAIDSDKYDYNPQVRAKMRRLLEVEEKLLLCHVGRIVYQKNPKGLIDIFASCHQQEKNSVLLWAGTGDMEEEAKAYAREKGVEDSVRFLGVRKDIPALMQAADAFLLPSIYEGLPIVAVEAQAAGLPCFRLFPGMVPGFCAGKAALPAAPCPAPRRGRILPGFCCNMAENRLQSW